MQNLLDLTIDEAQLSEESSLRSLSSAIQADPLSFESFVDSLSRHSGDEFKKSKQVSLKVLGLFSTCSRTSGRKILDSSVFKQLVGMIEQQLNPGPDVPKAEDPAAHDPFLLIVLENMARDYSIKSWIGENLFSLFFTYSKAHGNSPLIPFLLKVLRTCSNLHPANQEKIAANLFDYISSAPSHIALESEKSNPSKEPLVNQQSLQNMVEIFSFEDRVSLCFHSKEAGSKECPLSTVQAVKMEPIRFDPTLCNSSLDIDETGRILTSSDRMKYVWRTALCSRPLKTGSHRWEVVIEKTSSTCNIMIGVCERHQQLSAYPGGGDHNSAGWSYYGCSPGYVYHNSRNKDYGEAFRTGDIIGVILDMDEGTLAFSKNGIEYGIAYSSDLVGKELYPAVSLYDVGDRVSIRDDDAHNRNYSSAFTVDVESPFKCQRPSPILSCPPHITLQELEIALLGKDSDKSMILQLLKSEKGADQKEHLNKSLTLAEVRKKLVSNEHQPEIIDIIFEFTTPSQSTVTSVPQVLSRPTVLEKFAAKGGLSKLVTLLFHKVRDSEGEDLCKDNLKLQKWLFELNCDLKIPSFVDFFIINPECCHLLFSIMRGSKTLDENPRCLNPKNPSEQIQNILQQLFKKGHAEVRKAAVESETFGFLLARLSELSAVEHRKSEQFSKYDQLNEKKRLEKQAEERKQNNTTSKSYWAKGTGYGTHGDPTTTWNHVEYLKQQESKAKQINMILRCLKTYLDGPLPSEVPNLLEASCLVPVLEDYLRNDSLLDVGRQMFLYHTVLQLVRSLVSQESLIPLLDSLSNQSASLFDLMNNLNRNASIVIRRLNPKSNDVSSLEEKLSESSQMDISEPSMEGPLPKMAKKEKEMTIEDQLMLATEISKLCQLVQKQVERHRDFARKLQNSSKNEQLPEKSSYNLYISELKSLQFEEISMIDDKGELVHHFKSRINAEPTLSPVKLRRLIQETGALSNGLPLHLDSSVFLRINQDRIDVMKALVTGPVGTPYEHGCFVFDMYCLPEYPDIPPVVNLQTTGGGTVRFNPNLYNCGKVCLSLLGTWSGGANEKWNAKTSTLLQVLVSIQSLIFIDHPYYNEPGYETQMNTPQGNLKTTEYNEGIRAATVKWAILEQLKKPAFGFENVIHAHFKLKKDLVLNTVQEWVKESQNSRTEGYHLKMKKLFEDLKQELQNHYPTEKQEEDLIKKRWESAAKVREAIHNNLPIALCFKALEFNSDKHEDAVNWIVDKGRAYLDEHPELFDLKPMEL